MNPLLLYLEVFLRSLDSMLLFGIGLLLWRAREYVDFSVRELFLVPSLAIATGIVLASSVLLVPGIPGSDWRTGSAKLAVYAVVYVGISVALERRQIRMVTADLARMNPLQRRRKEPRDG